MNDSYNHTKTTCHIIDQFTTPNVSVNNGHDYKIALELKYWSQRWGKMSYSKRVFRTMERGFAVVGVVTAVAVGVAAYGIYTYHKANHQST